MKLTRLELVQKVLSSLNEDNITSIGESEVSIQIASLLDVVYTDLVGQFPWPFLDTVTMLETTSDPHIMRIPEGVFQINWVRYNKRPVIYKKYEDMVEILDSRNQDNDNVDSNGAITNCDPSYWTSLDEEYIIFDSYNEGLVPSLSSAHISTIPPELDTDDQYPVIPAKFVPVLLWGLLAQAHLTLDGDDSLGGYYEKKHKAALAQMKTWGKKIRSANESFFTLPSYARATHTKSVKVIESAS